MAEDYAVRLVAYETTGERRGAIVAPIGITHYAQYNGVPTLKATWTEAAGTHDMLNGPCMVAVETRRNSSDFWTERRDSRFVSSAQTYDRRDITQARSQDFVGLLGMLGRTGVGETYLDNNGERAFNAESVGDVMQQLLEEAQDRAALSQPYIIWDFNSETDSLGNPWTATVTRGYPPSTTLLAVLQDFAESGLVDFWFDGTVLRMSAYGTGGTSRTSGPGAVWLRDYAIPASPEKESWADIANSIVVLGEDGYKYRRNDLTNNQNPFLLTEEYIDAPGVTTQAQAEKIIAARLRSSKEVARSYSREWTYVDDGTTPYVPGRDFFPGDAVLVDTPRGRKQSMRVADYSVSADQAGSVSINVTLGIAPLDPMSQLIRANKALTQGRKPMPTGYTSKPAKVPQSTIDGILQDANDYTDAAIDAIGGGGPGITVDPVPTAGSSNPVASGGVHTALQNKADKMTFDQRPTDGSSNPVTSNGIYDALQELKALIPDFDNLTEAQMRRALVGLKIGVWTPVYSVGTARLYSEVQSFSSTGRPTWRHRLSWQTMNNGLIGLTLIVGVSTMAATLSTGKNISLSYTLPSTITGTVPDDLVNKGAKVTLKYARGINRLYTSDKSRQFYVEGREYSHTSIDPVLGNGPYTIEFTTS